MYTAVEYIYMMLASTLLYITRGTFLEKDNGPPLQGHKCGNSEIQQTYLVMCSNLLWLV